MIINVYIEKLINFRKCQEFFFFLIEFSDFPSGVNERSKGGILEGYVLRKYKNAHSTAQEAKVHFDKAIQTTNRYIS